ncbi:MAG TPA: hypothetical protein VGL42_17095 [Opitutaceae bacterium]
MPPILQSAFTHNRAEADHWAFTETIRTTDYRGRETGATIVRVDPSLPYAEQFRPIQVSGHAPTTKDRQDFERLGDSIGKQEADRPADAPPEIQVNDMKAAVDVDSATLVGEDARTWSFRLPLKAEAKSSLPTEKLELILRVSKSTLGYDSASLRLISPWRTRIVVKVNEAHLDLRWNLVDPKHSPLMVAEDGTMSASILFVHRGGWLKVRRTDFKRVTPFADRFGVKLGPLKVLPF